MNNLEFINSELIRLHDILKSEWATNEDREFAKKLIEALISYEIIPYMLISTGSGIKI